MSSFTPTSLLVFLVLGTAALAAPGYADVEVHSDAQTYLVGTASRVAVNLSFGEVQIEGTEGSEVRIELRLTCSRRDLDKCRRRAERIRVVPRIKKDKFVVRLTHTPRGKLQGLKAHVKLSLPSHLKLDVDMVNGDVFVTRMLADVEIDGVGGDVDVVALHALTGNVSVQVGAGKAELWMGDGHMKGSGFPRSIRWRGPGAWRIDIDLGAGEARVRLE